MASCALRSVIMLVVVAGCGTDISATGNRTNAAALTSAEGPFSFDTGVVLADRSGYCCLPFEYVGLRDEDRVLSIASSCECIQPAVVKYLSPGGSQEQAVLLEYAVEPHSANAAIQEAVHAPSSVSLRIIVQARLADGRTHEFTLNLLRTVLGEENST